MKCHLQGAHPKLKTVYSKLVYIYTFHNLQYNLLLMPVRMWINYVNLLMYGRYYV